MHFSHPYKVLFHRQLQSQSQCDSSDRSNSISNSNLASNSDPDSGLDSDLHSDSTSNSGAEVKWIVERIIAALREAPWDEEHLERGKQVKVWFRKLRGPYEDVEVIEVSRPGMVGEGRTFRSGEEMDEYDIFPYNFMGFYF